MRVAVRERAILLWHMSSQEDQFERDDLYMQFHAFGSHFGHARLEYLATNQTDKERNLFFELDKETNKRAPGLRVFADKLVSESNDQKTYLEQLNKTLTEQTIVSGILDVMIHLQQTQNEEAHKQTAATTTKALSDLVIWMLIFIFAVILFARTIVQAANRLSKKLSKTNRKLSQLARNDHLTGLPNRLFLAEHLEFILSHANRHKKKGALLYIDLDDFKPINDTYGHSVGDKYLQAISIAIKKLLRDSDVLVRLGGDEFVVVLYEISAEKDAIEVANKLLKILSAEYILDDITVSASASIGIYCFPKAEMTVDNLISAADAAMYNAKQSGKNKYFIQRSV
jgi:diguanylate cyclase (GGDEF)-like protein